MQRSAVCLEQSRDRRLSKLIVAKSIELELFRMLSKMAEKQCSACRYIRAPLPILYSSNTHEGFDKLDKIYRHVALGALTGNDTSVFVTTLLGNLQNLAHLLHYV